MEFLLPGPEVTHTHSLRERSNGPGEFDSLPPPQAHQDLPSCFHAHTSSGFHRGVLLSPRSPSQVWDSSRRPPLTCLGHVSFDGMS